MGIWFIIFICGGIGVHISLKYLGKMLSSLIIFGFIVYIVCSIINCVNSVGLECITFCISTTIIGIISIISFIKLLFILDNIIETNNKTKGTIDEETKQKIFEECFEYYKKNGYNDEEAWESAIEDLKNNKIL